MAPATNQQASAARLVIGLLQGATLYVLFDLNQAGTATFLNTWQFTAACLIAGLVPFVLLAAISSMRSLALALWALVIIGAIVTVTLHSFWRDPMLQRGDHAILAFPLMLLLFVSHHLVAASDADRAPFARYATYFDIGWKNGVQLALSLAFLGAFWLLLWLGANLFELINITIITEIIQEAPFAFLASSIVFALAVQITDARFALIVGARTIALMLLSWLLPIMTAFAVAFLISLIFVGLTPLWNTGNATALLMISGATLITLINATYQDGDDDRAPPTVLKGAAQLAAVSLVPIAAIAFYSIWLRVDQHGLTPQRVIGLATVALGSVYALGYAIAAFWPGKWMKPLEATNVFAAAFAIIVGMSLLTHIADPARLSVEDQVRRLKAGLVSLDKFDFDFLRFDAGQYGRDALKFLADDKTSPTSEKIAAKADEAMKRTVRLVRLQPTNTPPLITATDLKAQIRLHPSSTKLDDSFYAQNWGDMMNSPVECVRNARPEQPCEAMLADVDRDGRADVLLRVNLHRIQVFRQTQDRSWESLGGFNFNECVFNTPPNFGSGLISLAPPTLSDLVVAGRRYRLADTCSDKPSHTEREKPPDHR